MGKVMFMRKGEVHTAPSNLPAVGIALNACTWEQIRAISDAGVAANYFAAGDTKSIIINGTVGATTFSNLSVDAFIIGIDHNSSREGINKIHFQLGKIDGVAVALCDSNYGKITSTSGAFIMNGSGGTNENGWSGCYMRETILGSNGTPTSPTSNTLLAALPADLLAVMKPVTKYTDNVANDTNVSSNVTATTDYLPLLSEFEVHGSIYESNTAEKNYQKQYDYYKAGNSKIKYNHSATGTAVRWWNRSPYTGNDYTFCVVKPDGSYQSAGLQSNYSEGIAPLFCV